MKRIKSYDGLDTRWIENTNFNYSINKMEVDNVPLKYRAYPRLYNLMYLGFSGILGNVCQPSQCVMVVFTRPVTLAWYLNLMTSKK